MEHKTQKQYLKKENKINMQHVKQNKRHGQIFNTYIKKIKHKKKNIKHKTHTKKKKKKPKQKNENT
jgi:hypothetical protein